MLSSRFSCYSSSSSSDCDTESDCSVDSNDHSISTGVTSVDFVPSKFHSVTILSQYIHLPLNLPFPPSIPEVDIDQLILEKPWEEIPRGFILHKLRSLGPALLHSSSSTRVHLPEGPKLPSHILCTFPTNPSTSTSIPIPQASHVLAIRSMETGRSILVPVQGLVYATRCANLAILSSPPEHQPSHPRLPSCSTPPHAQPCGGNSKYLPVVSIQLPCIQAFPLLQAWMHLNSPEHLLSSIIPPVPNRPRKQSLPTFGSLSEQLAFLPMTTLLSSVRLVNGLWRDTVALGISDEMLWSTMRQAWGILVAALAKKEGARRKRN